MCSGFSFEGSGIWVQGLGFSALGFLVVAFLGISHYNSNESHNEEYCYLFSSASTMVSFGFPYELSVLPSKP